MKNRYSHDKADNLFVPVSCFNSFRFDESKAF